MWNRAFDYARAEVNQRLRLIQKQNARIVETVRAEVSKPGTA
jgi:hypothetical protein